MWIAKSILLVCVLCAVIGAAMEDTEGIPVPNQDGVTTNPTARSLLDGAIPNELSSVSQPAKHTILNEGATIKPTMAKLNIADEGLTMKPTTAKVSKLAMANEGTTTEGDNNATETDATKVSKLNIADEGLTMKPTTAKVSKLAMANEGTTTEGDNNATETNATKVSKLNIADEDINATEVTKPTTEWDVSTETKATELSKLTFADEVVVSKPTEDGDVPPETTKVPAVATKAKSVVSTKATNVFDEEDGGLEDPMKLKKPRTKIHISDEASKASESTDTASAMMFIFDNGLMVGVLGIGMLSSLKLASVFGLNRDMLLNHLQGKGGCGVVLRTIVITVAVISSSIVWVMDTVGCGLGLVCGLCCSSNKGGGRDGSTSDHHHQGGGGTTVIEMGEAGDASQSNQKSQEGHGSRPGSREGFFIGEPMPVRGEPIPMRIGGRSPSANSQGVGETPVVAVKTLSSIRKPMRSGSGGGLDLTGVAVSKPAGRKTPMGLGARGLSPNRSSKMFSSGAKSPQQLQPPTVTEQTDVAKLLGKGKPLTSWSDDELDL